MKTPRLILRGLAALAAIGIFLVSCSDNGLVSTDSQFTRVMLVPSPASLEDGTSAQVRVVGVQVGGRQVSLAGSRYAFQWTSSDPNVLRVVGSGHEVQIEAVAPGRASVSVDVTLLSAGEPAAPSGSLRASSEIVATAVPTDLTLTSTNNLTGMAGGLLPESVTVRVVDRRGAGVSGVPVTFEVLQGGGSVSDTTSTTNVDGYASTAWRLGSPGTNRLRGRSDRPKKNVDVDANGETADPAAMNISSGNNQTGAAGSNLPNRLSVRVIDAEGRPIPAVPVIWAVRSGGGTIAPQTAPTDDQGVSAVYWTLGTTAGTQTSRATVGTFTADFAATARAGAAARLIKLSGDVQSGALSTRLADSLAVQVVDQFGNSVSGSTVNWSVVTGGGSVSPASTASNAGGIARAAWTMGSTLGGASARASITGIDEELFTATATTVTPPPPPPPSNTLVKLSGDGQSGAIATRLTDSVAVRVQNSQGAGVAGVTVTWAVTSGGGTVSPASGLTNSNGVVRAAWTMGPATGPAMLKATAGTSEVSFNATATPSTGGGGQLTITKMSGDAQTGTVSTRLADSLVVQVKDAQGAAVSGVVVSWSVVSGNGSVSPASFTTNGSGFARTAWTLGANTGAGSVSASATNATPVTFSSTANAPVVANVVISPAADTITTLNGQVTLVASARTASNQVVPNTQFSWSSLNPSIATVDAMGTVTGRAVGRALIIASAVCCSRADTATIDVIVAPGAPGAPGAVTIATSNVNADTFQVTARWGRAANAASYNWSSGSSSGSWNRSGQAADTFAVYRAARTAGDYWMCVVGVNSAGTASTENACNTYVAPAGTPAPVATVTVTPASPSIGIGASAQLTATLRDANNNVLTGRVVTWSGSGAIATVNTSGLVVAVALGTATITATSEGQSGTATVTVTAAPPPPTVTAINVSPAQLTLATGQSQQFIATATLSDGSTQNNPSVSWSATGGTISTGGMYTAGSTTGSSYRVIASGSGRADTSTVSITTPPPQGSNDMFFNSTEVGCGTDPNVLMCDDFEDGEWYGKHCDDARASGGLLQTDGWCGTIYANPITPVKAADCTPGVTPFGQCAATSGPLSHSSNNRNMADHAFPNNQEVQELWVRWYYKPSVGFSWSGQKVMSFNRCCAGGGGIYWAGFGYNIGAGSPRTGAPSIGMTNNLSTNQIWGLNVSSYAPTGGRWSYYEIHIKLNTPGQSDGVLEFWANDCGTTGCSGTPTLRARHTNVNWGKTLSNGGIGTLWWENWANSADGQGSQGTEWYDRIKVSRGGAIGF